MSHDCPNCDNSKPLKSVSHPILREPSGSKRVKELEAENAELQRKLTESNIGWAEQVARAGRLAEALEKIAHHLTALKSLVKSDREMLNDLKAIARAALADKEDGR